MKRNRGLSFAIFTVLFVGASLWLGLSSVTQKTNTEEKASGDSCPGVEACPLGSDHSLLVSCHPADPGNPLAAQLSTCTAGFTGRRETCGSLTKFYCCNGSAWVVCPPTPTPSPSPTPLCVNTNPNSTNPWDVNQDGHVNIVDIGLIIDNYSKSPSNDPRTDVNGDCMVGIVDIGLLLDHYSL